MYSSGWLWCAFILGAIGIFAIILFGFMLILALGKV
jgi:hypothetical protein